MIQIILLAIAFLFSAILYASVGFGGGSTYNALLVLAGVDYSILVPIALCCNITVVSGSTIRYSRAGFLKPRLIAPLVIASLPAAWIGGSIAIDRETFTLVLGISLLVSAVAIWFNTDLKPREIFARSSVHAWGIGIPFGLLLGGLAGVTGIGGGIFLAPVLNMVRYEKPKVIAATCAVFILVNSIAGLTGQLSKSATREALPDILAYWPLFIAVLIGGQLGSWLGIHKFDHRKVRRGTAILIAVVSLRLLVF